MKNTKPGQGPQGADPQSLTRRKFFSAATVTGAAGVGALALSACEKDSEPSWDHTADVVVIGAGVSGLPAAVTARDHGASVIVIDENFDIGGHGMLSGGRINLGGGHALQQKLGITDSAEQVFLDWIRADNGESRFSDRDLIRVFADESVPTFDFLTACGVEFIEKPIGPEGADSVARQYQCKEWHVPEQIIAPRRGRNGSGLVRRMEESAKAKGAIFLLQHKMTGLVRENDETGRVIGIDALYQGKPVRIRANKGVVLATGGHTGNVNFRRMFDPRLTDEYQQAGGPYSWQNADGEIAAMSIGASLWSTANQTTEAGVAITKTRHIGCQWGYSSVVFEPDSPIFNLARATGLTVKDWQNIVLVNQTGNRFWNEDDASYDFFAAAMAYQPGDTKRNGGGPIWAIFDSEGAKREEWNPAPPHVDLDGYFAQGETLEELAANIKNPHQPKPIPGDVLKATVERYNSFVDAGADADFKKPAPLYKIQTPPFYAAWSTPILHDTMTGLRTTMKCEVMNLVGEVIPGLYACGETQGGFAQHGLARCLVFGRVAGRSAANDLK